MTDEYKHILQPYRDQIDDLDDKIVELLQTREGIIRSVAALKKDQNIPAVLPNRVNQVINRCTQQSKEQGSDGQYVQAIYTEIVQQSCDLEAQIMTDNKGINND